MSAGDKEYISETVSLLIDGVATDTVVEEPTDGNTAGLVGLRSYRCVICGFDYKEDRITMFRGKPYGIPCGCSKDIRSIVFKEREDRRRSHIKNDNYRSRR